MHSEDKPIEEDQDAKSKFYSSVLQGVSTLMLNELQIQKTEVSDYD
jgi:hypothetical protein